MIGVLALQGAFQKHIETLKKIGAPCKQVKHPEDLSDCRGLILPGGETTAHLKLLTPQFREAILLFGASKPIFGTCCGLILLSSKVKDQNIPTFNFIDIEVERNAYGSQVESFAATLDILIGEKQQVVQGYFIRAPKVLSVGKQVRVLARYEEAPVVVQQGIHLAASFHPELLLDSTLHQYFVDLSNQIASDQLISVSQ